MIGSKLLLSPVWVESLAHVYNQHLHLLRKVHVDSRRHGTGAQVSKADHNTRAIPYTWIQARLRVCMSGWCILVGLSVRRRFRCFMSIGESFGKRNDGFYQILMLIYSPLAAIGAQLLNGNTWIHKIGDTFLPNKNDSRGTSHTNRMRRNFLTKLCSFSICQRIFLRYMHIHFNEIIDFNRIIDFNGILWKKPSRLMF